MSTPQNARKNALVYGFVREQEEKLKLSMHITTVIVELILKLFPVIAMTFGEINEKLFKISDDRTIVKIKNNKRADNPCKYHMLYANIDSEDGLNKGIHMWSIKLVTKNWKSKYVPTCCSRTVGITTVKNVNIELKQVRNSILWLFMIHILEHFIIQNGNLIQQLQ